MRLYVTDRLRRHTGHEQSLRDDFTLPLDAWCRVTYFLRAVVVDRRALDHRHDVVTIGYRFR